jgi:hypothetical protein
LIATACGYGWPLIDEMTIPQYLELAAYWRKYPPAHLLLRAALGYKANEPRTSDLGGLFAEAGDGGIFGRP